MGLGYPNILMTPSVDPVQPCNIPCALQKVIIDHWAILPSLMPTFPSRWRAYLINLCHRCTTEGVDHWLGTLPVLHYCMQQSPPRKASKSQPEDTWAGLEGISFAQFRDKASPK